MDMANERMYVIPSRFKVGRTSYADTQYGVCEACADVVFKAINKAMEMDGPMRLDI